MTYSVPSFKLLIDTVALLHQRPIRRAVCGDRSIEYIEVIKEDIEAAHTIAHEVLGRSLDELPPVTRKLLGALSRYVAERAQAQRLARHEVRFTRRELREACGWGDTQLRLHLQRLVELELLASERGGPGGQLRYTLCQEASDDAGRSKLCGLADVGQLEAASTMAKSRGDMGEVAGWVRGDSGPVAGGVRGDESAVQPATMRLGDDDAGESAQTHVWHEQVPGASYLQGVAL